MSKPTSNSDMTNKQENNLTINDLFRFADLYFYKKNYMYRHLYDSYNKFLEEDVEACKKSINISGVYETKDKEKRISVFEPNLNVVKNSLTPIITGEKFYRKAPELLKKVSLFCANEIKTKPILVDFVKDLDTGDIILYQTSFWYSRLIEYFTKCPYSHISIVLKKPTWLDVDLRNTKMATVSLRCMYASMGL